MGAGGGHGARKWPPPPGHMWAEEGYVSQLEEQGQTAEGPLSGGIKCRGEGISCVGGRNTIQSCSFCPGT